MAYKREVTPEQVVQSIISENINSVETSVITVDNDFDLTHVDKLETANIILDVEETLGVDISQKDFKHFKNVGDLVAHVNKHMTH